MGEYLFRADSSPCYSIHKNNRNPKNRISAIWCGYVVYEREVIPALGHNYNTCAGGKAPTCTEQGIKGTYTQCNKCGEYQGDVTFIDATGHSWGEWIFVEDHWYEEYGYGEKLYVRYCNECDEYQETWYWYEDPNDTGSPNDWESGGAGPGKP